MQVGACENKCNTLNRGGGFVSRYQHTTETYYSLLWHIVGLSHLVGELVRGQLVKVYYSRQANKRMSDVRYPP